MPDLIRLRCPECDELFGVLESLFHQRYNDHETCWCPLGHPFYWSSENCEENLAAKLEEIQKRCAFLEGRFTHLADQVTAMNRGVGIKPKGRHSYSHPEDNILTRTSWFKPGEELPGDDA